MSNALSPTMAMYFAYISTLPDDTDLPPLHQGILEGRKVEQLKTNSAMKAMQLSRIHSENELEISHRPTESYVTYTNQCASHQAPSDTRIEEARRAQAKDEKRALSYLCKLYPRNNIAIKLPESFKRSQELIETYKDMKRWLNRAMDFTQRIQPGDTEANEIVLRLRDIAEEISFDNVDNINSENLFEVEELIEFYKLKMAKKPYSLDKEFAEYEYTLNITQSFILTHQNKHNMDPRKYLGLIDRIVQSQYENYEAPKLVTYTPEMQHTAPISIPFTNTLIDELEAKIAVDHMYSQISQDRLVLAVYTSKGKEGFGTRFIDKNFETILTYIKILSEALANENQYG